MRRFALIPAYKPNENLIYFVQSLEKRGIEVVVVDDGSGEEYLPLFSQLGKNSNAKIIRFYINQGKGAALKEGLSYLNNIEGDFTVITLDADGQHSLKDAIYLLEKAAKSEDVLILGSREQSKGSPLRSRIGNYITKKVFYFSTGVDIEDTQTGMRAFKKSLIPKLLDIKGERYEYEMNMLLEFAKEGIKMKEYPIETIYINDNEESHFDTVKDSIRIYSQIIKFCTSSLLSFGIDFLIYSISLIMSGSILFSNAFARIISLHFNFFMNKKFVFEEGKSGKISSKEYFSYLGLAAFIFVMNTLILRGIVETFHINAIIAKILTEVILFTLSYLVQKKLVFSRENKKVAQIV